MSDIISIAHRGASGLGHAPENTLIAFWQAIEIGVHGLECDVHGTKDGKVVVMHDHTLNRTTDCRGIIEKMTLAEVKKADAGAWFDPRFAGERVPTLRELLEMAKGKAITVIEVKANDITDKVIQEIEEADAVSEVVLQSFHANVVEIAQKINPLIPRALLIGGRIAVKRLSLIVELVQSATKIGASVLNLSSKIITPELVKESHRRGIGVWGWTVDEADEMLKMAEMGVDGITSNYPKRLHETLSIKPITTNGQ